MTGVPYYQDDHVTIYHGDCRDVLPGLPCAVGLFTDPPYGIPAGAAFWRRNGTALEDWGEAGHNRLVAGWRSLVNLAPDSAIIVEFGSGMLDSEDAVRAGHVAAGWTPWRRFVWAKSAPAPTVRATMVSAYESAVISSVGKRPWFGSGYVPDCWIGMSPNRANKAEHPTQKPIEPFLRLIDAFTPADGLIVDPFMGSGTTLRAAKDLGRKAIGIEIEERYCEIAANRMGQEVLNFGGAA